MLKRKNVISGGIKYRNELKYLCSEQELGLLRARIRHICTPDPHAGASGRYTVRSVYFDDYADTCYYENEDGTDCREIDTPLNPSAQGLRALSAYFSGLTDADVQKERDEVLQATPEQIRALAPLVRAVLSQRALCVIGNEEKIREEQGMFGSIQMPTGAEE